MLRLLYISKSAITAERRLPELRDIRQSANRHNNINGITGMLIFEQDKIAQVLEGERLAVTNTFGRIARDDRHTDVELLEVTSGHDRLFGAWGMRVVTAGPENSLLFKRFAIDGGFRPELMEAETLVSLMVHLSRVQPSLKPAA
jgi:hypothetical protein